MYYYLVAVGSQKYHGKHLLTYQSTTKLKARNIVAVPLQKQTAYAFVVRETTKPDFPVKEILELPATLAPLPKYQLKLFEWLRAYYPAPLGITAQLFLPKSLPKKLTTISLAATKLKNSPSSLPPLTVEQKNVLSNLSPSGAHILHGATGSGKTRIYIEATKQSLASDRSAIILTPEISLTSQLARNFVQTFGEDRVLVIHSHLSEATRRNLWLKILNTTQPLVVIGPRSALFSPLKSIGLIVVDESHEFTYKQENAPHYHASRIASKLAELHNARLILGSATPSVEDYYLAEQKKRPVLRMAELARGRGHTADIHTVDMRDKSLFSRNPHVSNQLLELVEKALTNQQQSLLFINRRGTARIVLCNSCGWQALCPRCDLPLTYHHDNHTLRCHTCGFSTQAMSSCPVCGGVDITLKSIGTKSIAAQVKSLFPSARVERFDTDNVKGERLHELYDDIHSGKIDILIGTQMLAKGLDLPRLGVVGVLNADASLYIPDFTAAERTYQLLYQIIGRIGRGHIDHAAAIIQTLTPDNRAIQSAIAKDWSGFYASELAERKQFLFPPFCHLLKLTCKRTSSKTAHDNAAKLVKTLLQEKLEIVIDGPAPAFHEKIQNKYVWQLVIKSKQRSNLLKVIDILPKDWSYDIDPVNLL